MLKNITNFKELIEEYQIKIPIIQRDYAQGRIEASIIRDKFLDNILVHLNNNKEMCLDFIYGSVKNDVFLPLDGQQRLTTIFLLYWYSGKKEDKEIDFLKKFTYETRASSREFCQKLIQEEFNTFEDSDKLSEKIKNSSWFLYFWDNDPTIKSMLAMIDDIHKKFNNEEFFDKLELLKFHFIKLENFNLDDDLYIKMNARGKKLTDFEIFKAEFEKFLISNKKNLFKEYFIKNIDGEWTDLFWRLGFKNKHYLIDDAFMNFFYFISEMLHVKNKEKTTVIDFENMKKNISKLIENVYLNDENIDFFFKAIKYLENIANFNKENLSDNFEKNKLALFDKYPDLLIKVINNDKGNLINLQQKILLFIIISNFVENEGNINVVNLLDKLRIVRNLTQRIRALKQGKIDYTATLSYEKLYYILNLSLVNAKENIYTYLINNEVKLTNTDISKDSLDQEVYKAKYIQNDNNLKCTIQQLEDYKYICGDLSFFLFEDKELLKFASDNITKIFTSKTHLIIRSLLTIEDYAKYIGFAGSGSKYYFGVDNKWEILLTKNNQNDMEDYTDYLGLFYQFFKKYKSIKDEFLDYDSNEILEQLILDYLNNKGNINYTSWVYYFIKHGDKIFNNTEKREKNYFVWYDEENFNIDKMYGETMGSKYVNTYVKILSEISNIHLIEDEQRSEYIKITDKIEITSCNKNGWLLKLNDKFIVENINSDFVLEKEDEDGVYILKHNKSQDVIEMAQELINTVQDN
ncbi:DUF262 domain-containing protein [Campylobacter jejuni]|uniref:DUF262 domain-containing protein n=23 Tax=Campylobacter TaxID=194 RepID=A0A615JPJ1_CAMJU|nr:MULTISPECIES: DUF262 domain-containing protein [Campylobacter]ALV99093.1 SigF [Campylobacter jejuni]ALW03876.1 SigF [Campylobacter jejuni]ALW12816.1 SigF [Campylobacter jejuni]ALW16643.1 SigF [Campylobacter jejuni]ALW24566.1 SigF [Campylobacter jejuni]